MRTFVISIIVLFSSFTVLRGQDYSADINPFAVSVTPSGFIFYGPIINAEFGLGSNLVLNSHIRFPSLGLLNYVVFNDDDNELEHLSGIAFGGGLSFFMTRMRSKPYAGFFVDYQKTDGEYALNTQWEWYQNNKLAIFGINGGYRFRFISGFFINTGAQLGLAANKWDWEYVDVSYGLSDPDPREGTDITPFLAVEVAVGIEF